MQQIDQGYSIVQSYISYILLGVSVVGLVLSLIILLATKHSRSSRSDRIHICFTAALLLASLMFLIQDTLINAENTGIIKLVGLYDH